jgi:GTPase SAR1 family protein
VDEGWTVVLEFLRAGDKVPVHELRLMLIGDGEAGKTSLQRAFVAPGHKADWIEKEQRTVAIDMSTLEFPSADGANVLCHVCDCAGQALYYFSHTMHFTRRCLYVLTWTAHKFSDSRVAQELEVDAVVSPLKIWLQLLAANVPEASVIVVGTHCRVQPEQFEAMRQQVGRHVRDEIARLRHMADAESAATREVLQQQETKARELLVQVATEVAASQLQAPAPLPEFSDVKAVSKLVESLRSIAKRGLMRHAEMLLKTAQDWTQTKARLCRLHAVYDGSVPDAAAPAACLKLVNEQSFAVDSREGDGVAELLAAIEGACRDKQALPFMGELVPRSWLQVSSALQQHQLGVGSLQLEPARSVIGDNVMSLADAVDKVRALLQTHLDVDVGLARQLDERGVQSSLEFWSLLGRVFLYDGHFLREPRLVVDLLKPLVHHNILDFRFGFKKEFLVDATDCSCDELLELLQSDSILDHHLLPRLKAWASAAPDAQSSMLKFFNSTFMVSAIRARDSSQGGGKDGPQRSLITARLFDSSDAARQQKASALVDDVNACAAFHALYALPSAHVGVIARLMTAIQELQPEKVALTVHFAQNHVCIDRAPARCAVSVRPLSDVFASKLASIQDVLPTGHYFHALVICSNDDGLFAFAARCADAMMQSGCFGSKYQCWLPYRSSAAVGSWRPRKEDWAKLSSIKNP